MLRHVDCAYLYNKIKDVCEAADTSGRALEALNEIWELLDECIVIGHVIECDGEDLKIEFNVSVYEIDHHHSPLFESHNRVSIQILALQDAPLCARW
jgi:hypothetical protein